MLVGIIKATVVAVVVLIVVVTIAVLYYKESYRSLSYWSKRNERVHRETLELLGEVLAISGEQGIPYFALGGTMLGAKRHAGFIPWDDDVDLAVVASAPIIQLDSARFDVNRVNFGYKITYAHAPHIFIDVFTLVPRESDGNYIYTCSKTLKKWPQFMMTPDEVSNLEPVPFEHLRIPCPVNALDFLHRFYGQDVMHTRKITHFHRPRNPLEYLCVKLNHKWYGGMIDRP